MWKLKYLLAALIIPLIIIKHVTAEGPDQMGREFVLSFWHLVDGSKDQSGVHMPPSLYISTMVNEPVAVTVSTPLLSSTDEAYFQLSLSIQRGTYTKVDLPIQIRTGEATNIYDKTVLVQAADEVAIQAMNMEDYNGDGFTAYPTDALGQVYYLVTANNHGAFLIMATASGQTKVDISLEGQFLLYKRVYRKGQVLSVTLEQYQVFSFVDTNGAGQDWTATRIHADKPVAVITGNFMAAVGSNNKGTLDTIMAQSLPLTNWGDTYVLSPTPLRTVGEVYKIVSFMDNTMVELTGQASFTLQKDAMKEFEFSTANEFNILKSNNPVLVYKMSPSLDDDALSGDRGDPALSYMPALPQWTNQYVFSTMEGHPADHGDANILTCFMTLVIAEDHKAGLRWNGQPLSDTLVWQTLPSEPVSLNLVGVHIQLTSGAHDLYHTDPLVTFLVHTSGLGQYLSYTALAGSRAAVINDPDCLVTIPVEADIVDNDCDGLVDEERANGIDDDQDGLVDEDITYELRVDGNWGEWSESCAESCTIHRHRACDNPVPEGYGAPCEGSGTEDTGVNCCDNGPGLITKKPDPPDETTEPTEEQSTTPTSTYIDITTTAQWSDTTSEVPIISSTTMPETSMRSSTTMPDTSMLSSTSISETSTEMSVSSTLVSDTTTMNRMTSDDIQSVTDLHTSQNTKETVTEMTTELKTTKIVTEAVFEITTMSSNENGDTSVTSSTGDGVIATTSNGDTIGLEGTSQQSPVDSTVSETQTEDTAGTMVATTKVINDKSYSTTDMVTEVTIKPYTISESDSSQSVEMSTLNWLMTGSLTSEEPTETPTMGISSSNSESILEVTTTTVSDTEKMESTIVTTLSTNDPLTTELTSLWNKSFTDGATSAVLTNTEQNEIYEETKGEKENNLGVSVGVPLGLMLAAAVASLIIFALAVLKRKKKKENRIEDSTTSLARGGTNSESGSIEPDMTAVEI